MARNLPDDSKLTEHERRRNEGPLILGQLEHTDEGFFGWVNSLGGIQFEPFLVEMRVLKEADYNTEEKND